jgi:YHS domain-containing protein
LGVRIKRRRPRTKSGTKETFMKKTILALTFAVLAVCAFGAPTKVDKKTTIHCAVATTHVVNIAAATKAKHYIDYKGRRYFFCCGNCPTAFKKNPSKYAKNDSIPIPKHKKA